MIPYSIYVHLPFCRTRCPYCDFASNAASAIPYAAYRDAVIAEWRARGPLVGGGRLGSVYFGGGTPSLWPAQELCRMLEAFRPQGDVEITVEANPADADREWFETLVVAGATRFSIGVQALDDARLAFLGRRHDAAEAVAAVELAVASGVRHVGGDIIFGTPAHAARLLARELEALCDLGVDHVSAYELTVAPGTLLAKLVQEGGAALPGEDDLVELWRTAGEVLGGRGLRRYEVSSYARPGARSRHNEHYWEGGRYVGLGAGAHGFLATSSGELWRYANGASVEAYVAEASRREGLREEPRGLGPDGFCEPIGPAAAARERVMLGLRTARGAPILEIASALPEPERAHWLEIAEAAAAEGLARMTDGWIVPTDEGMLLADGLALRFFPT